MKIKNGEFWLGDCLELMKDIPDGSVDFVLCDPPYGILEKIGSKEGTKHGLKGIHWDNQINISKLYEEYNRILRQGGTCAIFSQGSFSFDLYSQHPKEHFKYKYKMIWSKEHFGNALISKKAPVSVFEEMLFFEKKYDETLSNPNRKYAEEILRWLNFSKSSDLHKHLSHKKFDRFFRTKNLTFYIPEKKNYDDLVFCFELEKMENFKTYEQLLETDKKYRNVFNIGSNSFLPNLVSFPKDKKGFHPTQKPVALFEYLIKTYSNEGDLILDNCAGSGTTAIAAENLNRRWICIEKEEEYYKKAVERVKNHDQGPQLAS